LEAVLHQRATHTVSIGQIQEMHDLQDELQIALDALLADLRPCLPKAQANTLPMSLPTPLADVSANGGLSADTLSQLRQLLTEQDFEATRVCRQHQRALDAFLGPRADRFRAAMEGFDFPGALALLESTENA
jgi:uncharacterized protein (DUF2267 family)